MRDTTSDIREQLICCTLICDKWSSCLFFCQFVVQCFGAHCGHTSALYLNDLLISAESEVNCCRTTDVELYDWCSICYSTLRHVVSACFSLCVIHCLEHHNCIARTT